MCHGICVVVEVFMIRRAELCALHVWIVVLCDVLCVMATEALRLSRANNVSQERYVTA